METGLKVWLVAAFGGYGPVVGVLGVAVVCLLNAMNYQCTAHYFVHTPYFSRRWLNGLFGVTNTLALGIPQTYYRVHHVNHHRYGNDTLRDGVTRDWSSTYRYGGGSCEPLWRYALLGPIRQGGIEVWRDAPRRLRREIAVQFLVLVAFWAVLAVVNLRGVLVIGVTSWYLGTALALAQNWLEHAGAAPGDRATDSVSSYGRLYNLVWFNNGYHQEHHYDATVHWTGLPGLTSSLPGSDRRRVVPYAHLWNVKGDRAAARPMAPEPPIGCADAGGRG